MSLLKAELKNLLPPINVLETLFQESIHSEWPIVCSSYQVLLGCSLSNEHTIAVSTDEKQVRLLVDALKDKLYEVFNTGHWSKVPDQPRQAFTISTFLGVVLALHDDDCPPPNEESVIIDRCLYDLDFGLLMGCPLPGVHESLLNTAIELIKKYKNHDRPQSPPPTKRQRRIDHRRNPDERCDIPVLSRPSVMRFQRDHFEVRRPAILIDCIGDWPAMTKWNQLGYLSAMAGDRTVPIEVGAHYTTEEWSQELVCFNEFIQRQIDRDAACTRIEYLAQHNLFDQVPALRADIKIPDYCCCCDAGESSPSPDIKAWLGPKGTVSPMHHDPKHNLLCQVFGHKTVILAAPEDGANLYPHADAMLANTSQVDAECVDLVRFPLTQKVKFFRLTLYAGEMLYMPPGWWHHIRSQEKSFSVSFWW